jgi:predicted dehydrogenase
VNPGKRVRIAIVGLGVRGRQWAAVSSLVPEAELAAVVETAAGMGVPDVPIFRSLSEAAQTVPLDAVVIATPPAVHRAILESAVEHRLAILCEKPLSETLDEAIAMVRLASGQDVPLLVGMNFRFLPVVAEARRRVQSQDLGRPIYASFTYLRNRASSRPDLNSYPATMEHPMLLEQSIHHLDLCKGGAERLCSQLESADQYLPGRCMRLGASGDARRIARGLPGDMGSWHEPYGIPLAN